jgi:hypothetical protein
MSYRRIVASGPKRFWLGFITNTPWKGRPLEIQLEFLRRTPHQMSREHARLALRRFTKRKPGPQCYKSIALYLP